MQEYFQAQKAIRVIGGKQGRTVILGAYVNRKKVGQKFIVLLIKLLEGCQ